MDWVLFGAVVAVVTVIATAIWWVVTRFARDKILDRPLELVTFPGGLSAAEQTAANVARARRLLYILGGVVLGVFAVVALVVLVRAARVFGPVRGDFISQWTMALLPYATAAFALLALLQIARIARRHLGPREFMRFVWGRGYGWREAYEWREDEKRLVLKEGVRLPPAGALDSIVIAFWLVLVAATLSPAASDLARANVPHYVDFASVVREGSTDDDGAALLLWVEPSGEHRKALLTHDWWAGYGFPREIPRMAIQRAYPVDFFQLYRHRAALEEYAREKGLTEDWPRRPGAIYRFTFRKLNEGRFGVELSEKEALDAGVEQFWLDMLNPPAK